MSDVVEAPWGHWQMLGTSPEGLPMKLLVVYPSGMLSLQLHRHRSEEWHPLGDGLIKYIEGLYGLDMETMKAGNVYLVPRAIKHRIINPTDGAISLIEIIRGKYDEEDIVRYTDAYGRK